MEKYLIALDQGTTSSRCIIFNKAGEIKSVAQKEFTQIYPQPGYVEHDPMEIWSSQLAVTIEAMAKLHLSSEDIAGIGITNQRETTIVWDKKTGKPIYNAIVWQCRRTATMIDELKQTELAKKIPQITGLVPDAYFSASKIKWILDHVEGAKEKANHGELLFGTVDSWLIYNLTKGKIHVTDYTNASRTMLYDIHELKWSQELLDYFEIPESMLPSVKPSSYLYGYTAKDLLGGEIPICGIAGDQQAALFGQCCFHSGDIKNTYGTGCFLLMHTGHVPIASQHGLVTTLAASYDGKINYALEGSVFVAGASIQWLRDGLRMIKSAPESQKYADRVEDTQDVYVVPAFTGLGAPYWAQNARGMAVGMTRGTSKEHFVRATLESIAYQSYDVIEAMKEDADGQIGILKVDGGASTNDFLMQFQSDICQTTVHRPKCVETTALGAAYLAGLAIGVYKNEDDIIDNWSLDQEFIPQMELNKKENLIKGWKKAVKLCLLYANDD
ncbi:MAG: glycerol kinase GlpK [Faecalibacillus sp.]